jgi:hypothetical protein
MNLDDVVRFIGTQSLGVVATTGPSNQPQAALVGIAVTDRCELIFDTVNSSRKLQNLRRDPRMAVVIGGSMDDERTLQCDGVADEPAGTELERIRDAYFARYPDGRDRFYYCGSGDSLEGYPTFPSVECVGG